MYQQPIWKRFASASLAVVVAAAILFLPVYAPENTSGRVYAATSFSDISKHWAKSYVQKAVQSGFVSGYSDGTFRPDRSITRAEFTKMLNAAIGNTGTTDISFEDVDASSWYYDDVRKGTAAGYIAGYEDGTFGPDRTITRQEAAVLLARIVPAYGKTANLSQFADRSDIASWASVSLQKMVGKGYIGKYDDGKLHPTDSLTRAQSAKIIVDILENESIVTNNQTIVQSAVTLKDTIYANRISVGEKVADGVAALNNCVVLGTLNIQGGGTKEGVIVQNSRIANCLVDRSDASVRVLAKGESTIVNTTIQNAAVLDQDLTDNTTGFGQGYRNIFTMRAVDAAINADAGLLQAMEEKGDITIGEKYRIDQIIVDAGARKTDIASGKGTVIDEADIYAAGTSFTGKGTINTLNAHADSISYETTPKKTVVDDQVTIEPYLQVDPSEALNITVSPANRAADVSITDTVEVKFSSKVHATGGTSSTITAGQAASLVLLMKGSRAGTIVPCTVSVNSNGAGVSLRPVQPLDYNTTYYLKIAAGDLTDVYDNTNELFLTSFTTEEQPQAEDPEEPEQPAEPEDPANPETEEEEN